MVYAHDAAGNRTKWDQSVAGTATISYVWSADGLLDTVRVGTGTAHRILYEYNVFGRLVRKSVNGVVRRHFVWDRDNLLADLDSTLLARRSEYAHYPGLDAPYALLTGAVTASRYIHRDLQGNVLGLTRPDGTIDNYTRGPEAWGRAVGGWANGSAIDDTLRLGWKGLVYEADSTKLNYVRARWYDASTRRFLTQDPIGLEGGINPYVFAENDPVNGSDPTGLCPADQATKITFVRNEDGDWVELRTCSGGGFSTHVWGRGNPLGQFGGRNPWNANFGNPNARGTGTAFVEWLRGVTSGGSPLTQEQSDRVGLAIGRLMRSNDPSCKPLGLSARKRFDAGKIRFGGITVATNGFVDPFSRTIYLGSQSFVERGVVGGVIAHEEYHLNNWGSMLPWNDTPRNTVYQVQAQCTAPY